MTRARSYSVSDRRDPEPVPAMSEIVEMDSKAIDSFFSRIVGMIPLSLYRHTLSEDQNAADDMREGNSKYFKVVMLTHAM